MEENTNVSRAVEELQGADKEQLKKVVEQWFEKIRMDGLKLGAQMISIAVSEAIVKNLKKGANSSLRDYQRAINRISEILSVQLKQQETVQNDLNTEEATNDGTAE